MEIDTLTRVGIFGWGIVAPRSPNIEAFARNLGAAETWLEPFHGYGKDNFLVGEPQFDFADYRSWIDARFPPNRFRQLMDKMDKPSLYAAGAFIQALGQNEGLEQELVDLGEEAHVYVGTGLGSLETIESASISLHRAMRRWIRFWATSDRNSTLRDYLKLSPAERVERFPDAPSEPSAAAELDREDAEEVWWRYWADRSPELDKYLQSHREIDSLSIEGDVESGKMRVLKEKERRRARLQKEWGAPDPPWSQVSANVIWNIQNIPASQISILGRIRGLAFAPVAACSTFGVALKLGLDAIRRGEAKAVVVGATDPPPVGMTVGAFYSGRVLAADGQVSKPLSGLRGTHVAGGSVIWVLGDYEHMTARGFKPVGIEPLAVGVSSDADHIITPSQEGPTVAIRQALDIADVAADEVATWDMHATATPGDYQEVATVRGVLPESVLISARKGTFGHGMSAGGGWELTAQYLGYERGELFPTTLNEDDLNPEIAQLHRNFVFDRGCTAPPGPAGKLSMGIGGINACIISRPW